MLELVDIHTYYGDSHVLQGTTLRAERGQVTAVLGRNGVGKTTLCRSLTGLTPARRGRIVIEDVDVTRLPAHRISEAGISLVPQGRRIFVSLTVHENLQIAVRAGEVGHAVECRARVRALSPPRGETSSRRQRLERRRTADAGDRASAGRKSDAARHGRADRGTRARACRGSGPADSSTTRGRHLRPARRAERRIRGGRGRRHARHAPGSDRPFLSARGAVEERGDQDAVSGCARRSYGLGLKTPPLRRPDVARTERPRTVVLLRHRRGRLRESAPRRS